MTTGLALQWVPSQIKMSNSLLAQLVRRGIASGAETGKFVLPSLPYDYDALEPVINREILQIHHQGHHQTYVTALNNALDTLKSQQLTNNLEGQIEALNLVKFNGGGHLNHSLYWKNLKPPANGISENSPNGQLLKMIQQQWNSFDKFKQLFIDKSAKIQGSGYGWLAFCPITRTVKFITTANQDILQSIGLIPLLTIDVWEHSYYLQYKNKRIDYLKDVWKIVNWDCVDERLEEAFSQAK